MSNMDKIICKIKSRLNLVEVKIKNLKTALKLDALSFHGHFFVEGKIFAYQEEKYALQEFLNSIKDY